MTAMSFFVLPFIGLMPVLAADNLGMDVKSLGYGLLVVLVVTGCGRGKPVIVEDTQTRLGTSIEINVAHWLGLPCRRQMSFAFAGRPLSGSFVQRRCPLPRRMTRIP